MPDGQVRGTYRATHFTIVRCSGPVAWLTSFRPMTTRRESVRWHTIWGAVIRPQRRTLSGRRSFKRRRISALSRGRPRVFMPPGRVRRRPPRPSSAEQSLSAALAEGGPRVLAAGFRFPEELLEGRVAPQRVE